MKIIILLCFFISPICFAEFYQWKDIDGAVHYSDTKPNQGDAKVIQLKKPVLINRSHSLYENKTRIISWKITENYYSHINLTVKYFYDEKSRIPETQHTKETPDASKTPEIWLSVLPEYNGTRSMNASVRPSKIEPGTGEVNIRISISAHAPKRHCTNQLKFIIYGKNIPTFHSATVSFSKCWTNNRMPPSTPKSAIAISLDYGLNVKRSNYEFGTTIPKELCRDKKHSPCRLPLTLLYNVVSNIHSTKDKLNPAGYSAFQRHSKLSQVVWEFNLCKPLWDENKPCIETLGYLVIKKNKVIFYVFQKQE